MFVLYLITLHRGHKKHQSSSNIYKEDAHKIWGHIFISKCAVGTTTVLLAQASIFLQNNAPLLFKYIAKVKLPPDETYKTYGLLPCT